MISNRIHALAIYEVLKTYSDENHILSNSDIIHYLKVIYDIEVNNRTIVNNIEALIEFGIDISVYLDNRKGYYLIDRDFEDSEIYLLCNCIHSAHFIPEKSSNELIRKLTKSQSKYKRKEFTNRVYINNSRKTKNMELLLNIEIIMEAIENKKAIQLIYMTSQYDKTLKPKREKPYVLFPYHIIQQNDNLYLLCRSENYEDLSYYRIDKMKNINILNQNIIPLKEDFDPYVYAKKNKFMFSGEVKNIYLRCHKRMLDDFLDQFGHDVTLHADPKDIDYFFARLQSTEQGIFYFALQYLPYCEVLEPVSIRDQLVKVLEEKLNIYKK